MRQPVCRVVFLSFFAQNCTQSRNDFQICIIKKITIFASWFYEAVDGFSLQTGE